MLQRDPVLPLAAPLDDIREPGVVAETLRRLGGVSGRLDLERATSRRALDAAVARGEVEVPARGRYVLPGLEAGRRVAWELSAVLSHRSAALHWGWQVKWAPERPDVSVPRGRKLTTSQRARVTVHRSLVTGDDLVDGVTSRDRTLIDCLRTLPADEALCILDSALRSGMSPAHVAALVRDARGPGCKRMRELAALGDVRAANPFESTLRWIAHGVPGLQVTPQVEIWDPTFLGRPDLVDETLRLVLEADSFEWHGGRADLDRDAKRYNALVVRGWLVLRFSWEEVMHHPDRVRAVLAAAVAERTNQRCPACAGGVAAS